MIDLHIFDLDGTLAPLGSWQPYNLAIRRMATLDTPWAIASNQGRVGLREWAEQDAGLRQWLTDRKAYPNSMPTPELVQERLDKIVVALDAGTPIATLAAYAYRNSMGKWGPSPTDSTGDPAWRHDWRKPAPGMLLEIMERAGVSAQRTLYIGDRQEDEAAAAAAHCQFQWAKDFFALG